MPKVSILDFLPKPKYSVYPLYHQGYYLEEYFMNKFLNSGTEYERQYIPVSWTSCYNDNHNLHHLQYYLNSFDLKEKYFVVCQHDDAPKHHKLPPDTFVFSAGGNYNGPGKIPIPLICSKIPIEYINTNINKDIFCSFVGSATHPIRTQIIQQYKNDFDFVLNCGAWNPQISQNALHNFINTTLRSKYTLCPRGYGTTSFRLYEAMQLNTVPVYISDVHDLPWSDELDWNEFCVLIKPNEINSIKEILKKITEDDYNTMLNKCKQVYEKCFTLDGMYDNIIRRLQ
jgi:hypothetical protein